MIQITVLHVNPITWGSFKHASWEELQVLLRYSAALMSTCQCTSKQVCETQKQTDHQSLHVNTDMFKYRSRTNHQLQHTFYPIKQGSGNSNQIVSFTMTIVLFSDLLYSCEMCWQMCVAEYVLQNGQREANFLHVVDCVRKEGEHLLGVSLGVPKTWILKKEECGGRLHVAITQISSQLAPQLSDSGNLGKLDILGMLECWSVWLSLHALCTPTLSLPDHYPRLHGCRPPFLQVLTQNLNPHFLCLRLSCSMPFL